MPDVRRDVTCLIVMTLLSGCAASQQVFVPKPDAIRIPTLQAIPEDLARSPQLRALVPRDTAGIEPTSSKASVELLRDALAALAQLEDAPRVVSGIAISDGSIDFTYEQNGVNGREVNAFYRPDYGIVVSDPRFDDEETYPLTSVDPTVPAALVAAIEQRVPNAVVARITLDVSSSYGFGLVWNVSVEDARGHLATVFADLDGAIVAVDEAT